MMNKSGMVVNVIKFRLTLKADDYARTSRRHVPNLIRDLKPVSLLLDSLEEKKEANFTQNK